MVSFDDFEFIKSIPKYILESGPIVSKLDDDFKPNERIDINSLRRLPVTKDNVNRFFKSYKPNADFNIKKINDGFMWLDNNELVCFVVTSIDTYDQTKIWINALEIVPKFRGHGIAPQILKVATSTLHAEYLGVSKKNEVALSMYKKAGFKIYDETKVSYFMKI